MERITHDRLVALLSYDSETGLFHWRQLSGYRSQVSGKVAGTLQANGYIYINIDRQPTIAHRLAWLYVYGLWPVEQIDHINGIRHDNRISNLRLASRSENMRNTKRKITNKSGFKGVHWSKECSKWRASIVASGKNYHLGVFESKDEAYDAYCLAAARLHGSFARFD